MINQQTADQKQTIIQSLLSIPGMLRASDLELTPQTKSSEQGAKQATEPMPALRSRKAVAANESIFANDPKARVAMVRRQVRTQIVGCFLDEVLAIAEIRDRIGADSDAQGRNWAAIIHTATRHALAGTHLPTQEADMVRLAVILIMIQRLMDVSAEGEDGDWVYRKTRSARAQMGRFNPQAALWLQYALDHAPEEGPQTDKSVQLKALAHRACLEAISRNDPSK